jgi:hypothetical protein
MGQTIFAVWCMALHRNSMHKYFHRNSMHKYFALHRNSMHKYFAPLPIKSDRLKILDDDVKDSAQGTELCVADAQKNRVT